LDGSGNQAGSGIPGADKAMVQRVVEFLVRQLTFLSRHALPPSFDTDYHIPSCALLQLALKNNTNAIVLSADCFDYSVHRLGSELNWRTLVRARRIVSSPFKQRRSILIASDYFAPSRAVAVNAKGKLRS